MIMHRGPVEVFEHQGRGTIFCDHCNTNENINILLYSILLFDTPLHSELNKANVKIGYV